MQSRNDKKEKKRKLDLLMDGRSFTMLPQRTYKGMLLPGAANHAALMNSAGVQSFTIALVCLSAA